MFEKANPSKSSNVGLLRGYEQFKPNENYILEEINRKRMLKGIKEGEYK